MFRMLFSAALLLGGLFPGEMILRAQEPATMNSAQALRFEQSPGYFHYVVFCKTAKEFMAQMPPAKLPPNSAEYGLCWYVKGSVARAGVSNGASQAVDGEIVVSPNHIRFEPRDPQFADRYAEMMPRGEVELKHSPGQPEASLRSKDGVLNFQFSKICQTCAPGAPVPAGLNAGLLDQEFALLGETVANFYSGWRQIYKLSAARPDTQQARSAANSTTTTATHPTPAAQPVTTSKPIASPAANSAAALPTQAAAPAASSLKPSPARPAPVAVANPAISEVANTAPPVSAQPAPVTGMNSPTPTTAKPVSVSSTPPPASTPARPAVPVATNPNPAAAAPPAPVAVASPGTAPAIPAAVPAASYYSSPSTPVRPAVTIDSETDSTSAQPAANAVNSGTTARPRTFVASAPGTVNPIAAPAPSVSAAKASAPAIPATPKMKPVKISSGAADGLLVKKVRADYPVEAKLVRLEGTVVLRAIIDRTGEVSEVEAVSGPPLLETAAVDAVKQWEYKPYKLNGQPVDVETTIEVVFALDSSHPVTHAQKRP